MCAGCERLRPIVEEFFDRIVREFPVDEAWLEAHIPKNAQGEPTVKPPDDNRAVNALFGVVLDRMFAGHAHGNPKFVMAYVIGAVESMVDRTTYDRVPEDAMGVSIRMLLSRLVQPEDVLHRFIKELQMATGIQIGVQIERFDCDNDGVPLPPVGETKH
jgi:hypothetical protein